MSKPVIGITSAHRNDENRFSMHAAYVEAVERGGGIPVAITTHDTDPGNYVDKLDGFVFSGGGDVCPTFYGGNENHKELGFVNRERDKFEIEFAKLLLKHNRPLLAICRGLQVVNVAMGGSLHEHLPEKYGSKVLHRGPNREKISHDIAVVPESRLASILQETEFCCPSFHHQSIKDLAPGFKVVATAPDGVIEAVESHLYPNLISLQWHPEYSADTEEVHQQPFIYLAEIAASRSSQVMPVRAVA